MSAAGYTNRIRTRAEAKVTKVQYPLQTSSSYNPLSSTIGCSPQYNRLEYELKQNCKINCPTDQYIIYYGDSAFLTYPDLLNGQHVADPPVVILNGGNSS